MICSVKPALTEDFLSNAKGIVFSNMLYVHLTKGQAYSLETNPSSRQRGCNIRTITATFQLKKSLVVSLKRLGAKTN
jgi:hypothetical protein